MNPWNATRRVTLAEPWSDWWIDAYIDPPIGQYLDMRTAVSDATADPSVENLDALVQTIEPLIATHNMTNRNGTPLTWSFRAMPARLVAAMAAALKAAQDGESAPPLTMPASSRGRGSPRAPSRRNTRSGT